MNIRDKKLAVLHQLSLETAPISLPDLLKKLDKSYVARTVRRWLAEMEQEGFVERVGQKRATKYKTKKPSQRNHKETSSCFSSKSAAVIEQVKRPLYERIPVTYRDEWLYSYKPNVTYYFPLQFRQQLHDAGKRLQREAPAGTYAHQIYNRLLIDLSYNSSRLEGNTYSLLDTQRLLLEGKSATGKLDEEKIMILNHKEAIRFLVDNAIRLTASQETICTIHYLLSDSLLESQYSGKVRDHNIRIGGSTYIPIEDPRQLQQNLNLICEKATAIHDPFEQSLFLLVHISYLQAFADVNKRTARLATNIPLIKQNLVPLSFNDVEREDYLSSIIAVYELQDVRPIIDLFIFSYLRTCATYDATVKAIGIDEIRVRFRQERRGVLREIILRQLTGKELEEYIAIQVPKIIPEEVQKDFLEDLSEDLDLMDLSRIAGLGISPEQLNDWLKLYHSY